MFGILTVAKDKALSELIKLLLNEFQFCRYGVITSLKANSGKKEICCTVDLKGEERPMDVRATFEIVKRGSGARALILQTVWTSREWLNLLASSHLTPESREIALPPRASALLKVFGV